MQPSIKDAINPTAGLETSTYIRERISPKPGDSLYLHLSDLRLSLESQIPAQTVRILDYGCGGSPYRALFNSSVYHRADIQGIPDLDFAFTGDSRISAASADYDCVLSTQVLEHVRDHTIYLSECLRVLRPGGKLILTTHGSYPDHGCPYDFRRWTADGLELELRSAGLEVSSVVKLTTGPRAVTFLNKTFHHTLVVSDRSPLSFIWRASRWLYRIKSQKLDRYCDRQFQKNRMVPSAEPGHEFYIALMAVATQPA